MLRKLFRKKNSPQEPEVNSVIECEEPITLLQSLDDDAPYLHFDSFNFKLAILQILMYDLNVLEPQFDLYDFVESYTHRPIYLQEEGYDLIPEVVTYFEELLIDKDYAKLITEIDMDANHEIYEHIYPYWDRNDDTFNITNLSHRELAQFKHLETIHLISNNHDEDLVLFKELNLSF